MLNSKFQPQSVLGSGEKDFLSVLFSSGNAIEIRSANETTYYDKVLQ